MGSLVVQGRNVGACRTQYAMVRSNPTWNGRWETRQTLGKGVDFEAFSIRLAALGLQPVDLASRTSAGRLFNDASPAR